MFFNPDALGFRLPSEAEWEYAARCGDQAEDCRYVGSDKLREVAWYSKNSFQETKAVSLKLSNYLGPYDINGNVWERCYDWFNKNYYVDCITRGVTKNPICRQEGQYRVMRGGSWLNNKEGEQYISSFFRGSNHPNGRHNGVGFRLVLASLSV